MPNYVGFLRGTADSHAHLGPDEAQRTLERYLAWSEDMDKAGGLVISNGLARGGRVVRLTEGVLASADGPHTEATEVVGGFIVIEAGDLDQAEKIFGTHPHLRFGPIEVRKVGENGCED
ncbi:YciI family protein [Qaidamihabitans albus]|uniref:YciI family protein n=1 Tax=Qaidamihabitans albus TaxID=2795733 RepID=UPI0018F10BC1|nr:YciI family protein [Qaidamihabitans albus]